MFLSAIRIGDFVYGTTGDFGPAFLTALNIKTGESAWQVRGFARASLLVYADGKVIVMNEDGDLALARLSPTGAEILSRAKIFDTTTWTAPTLVGTTLYARDREKIVALDLGTPGLKTRPPSDRLRLQSSAARGRHRPLRPHAPRSRPRPRTSPVRGSSTASTSDATFRRDSRLRRRRARVAVRHAAGQRHARHRKRVNTSQSRFYRPGKSTTTETAGGTITMTTSWTGKTLVAEGQRTTSGGAVTAVKETISRDGEALVIQIAAGDKTARVRYSRLTEIGPCTTFPNPCKKAGS